MTNQTYDVCTCDWTCQNQGMPTGPCRVHVDDRADAEVDWDQVPARNLFYQGATARDVARSLVKPSVNPSLLFV